MSVVAGIVGVVLLGAADAGAVTPLPKNAAPAGSLPSVPPRRGPPELDPALIIGPVTTPGKEKPRRYELRPAKDGSGDLLYEGAGYVAHVKTDGTVRFDDKGTRFNRGWSLIPFMPLPIPGNPTTLQGVALDFLQGRKKAPPAPRPDPRDAPDPPLPVPNVSRYRPDPREVCRPGDPCFFEGASFPASVAGQFDATDEIMRFNGKDPYRYDKAQFLAGTREVRVGMAVRALAADVRRASSELDAKLVEIGCDETRSRAERRAILLALRGELDGDTPEARAAAAKITRFIQQHFDAPPDAGVVPCGLSRG